MALIPIWHENHCFCVCACAYAYACIYLCVCWYNQYFSYISGFQGITQVIDKKPNKTHGSIVQILVPNIIENYH